MLTDLVPLLGVIFAVGLPLSIPIVMISLNYRNRRRLMELHHAERMAAIERGMEVPPLPIDLIDGQSKQTPQFVAAGAGVVLHRPGHGGRLRSAAGDDDLPVVFGLVPLGIGIAYLIYYAVEGRHVEARQHEMDMRERNSRLSQGPATL